MDDYNQKNVLNKKIHTEHLAQNKEAWLSQIQQKQQMIQDYKEYEKNAPVGSPMNYLQQT